METTGNHHNDASRGNLLGLLGYDLATFFDDGYTEIESAESDGFFMVIYERPLPEVESGCFDTVQFRVYMGKENVNGSNPINVRLYSKHIDPATEAVAAFCDRVHTALGNDDDNNTRFGQADRDALGRRNWQRVWSQVEQEWFAVLLRNDNTLELNIIYYNKMMEHLEAAAN